MSPTALVAFDLPVALLGLGLIVLLVSLAAMHPASMPTFERWWRESGWSTWRSSAARPRAPGDPAGSPEISRSAVAVPSVASSPVAQRRVVTGQPARLPDVGGRDVVDRGAAGTADAAGTVPVQHAGLARHVRLSTDGPRRRSVDEAEALIEHYLDTRPETLARAITTMIDADRVAPRTSLD